MQRRTFLMALTTTALVGLTLGQTTGAAFAQDAKDAPIRPDMTIGAADAKVSVVEYASFTCPHCQNWHATVWPEFKKNYIDTGKVKFTLREVYFDKFGLWAGMVAQCGGEMRYYGMVDMLYDGQKEWIGSGQPTEIADNLRKIGAKAGLSKDQIDACLNDSALAQSMVATYQKHATEDEVNATPTFFVNGKKYSNMSYEDFAKILDEALG